jgi:UrcA family protein
MSAGRFICTGVGRPITNDAQRRAATRSEDRQTASVVVSLRDLDLTSPGGRPEASRRIDNAAARLCEHFRNHERIDDQLNYFDCLRGATVTPARAETHR